MGTFEIKGGISLKGELEPQGAKNEALQILDISRKTLYDWIKSEKITSKKEGKKRLIWIDSDSGQTEVSPPKHTNTTQINN